MFSLSLSLSLCLGLFIISVIVIIVLSMYILVEFSSIIIRSLNLCSIHNHIYRQKSNSSDAFEFAVESDLKIWCDQIPLAYFVRQSIFRIFDTSLE